MPENGRHAGAEVEPIARQRAGVREKPAADQLRHNEHRHPAFGGIGQHDEDARRLAEDAEDIGRPDIAAADGADVHAPGLGHQEARGDGPQQIGDEHNQDVTNNWHRDTV